MIIEQVPRGLEEEDAPAVQRETDPTEEEQRRGTVFLRLPFALFFPPGPRQIGRAPPVVGPRRAVGAPARPYIFSGISRCPGWGWSGRGRQFFPLGRVAVVAPEAVGESLHFMAPISAVPQLRNKLQPLRMSIRFGNETEECVTWCRVTRVSTPSILVVEPESNSKDELNASLSPVCRTLDRKSELLLVVR